MVLPCWNGVSVYSDPAEYCTKSCIETFGYETFPKLSTQLFHDFVLSAIQGAALYVMAPCVHYSRRWNSVGDLRFLDQLEELRGCVTANGLHARPTG
jgi:hypothetical protein